MNEGKYDLLEKVYFETKEVETMFATVVKKEKRKWRAEALKEGRAEGRAEGKIEGKAEGKIETAMNMIKKGFETSIILEITGLSENKIEELRLSNKQ